MSIRRMDDDPTPYERQVARLYLIGGSIAAAWFVGGMFYIWGVGRLW